MRCSGDFRLDALRQAEYNVSLIPTDQVALDLSTDVTPGRARGGSARLEEARRSLSAAVRDVLGFHYWLPVHLGRGGESVIASMVAPEQTVLCNEVYVTARWSIERAGGKVIEVAPEAGSPFQGNVDPAALEEALSSHDVAFVAITAPRTLLSRRGGRPVSLANLTRIRSAIDHNSTGIPLILDASRILENAAWIERHEPGQRRRGLAEIARDQMALADIVYLSGRKDAGGTHGGLLAAADERCLEPLRNAAWLLEGSPQTGGMSADEMKDLAEGLVEAEPGDEIIDRVASLDAFGTDLVGSGVPACSWGSGAVYLDARAALPRVPSSELPAQTLVNLLYLWAGIRSLGTPPGDSASPDQIVRLCAPRSAVPFLREALPEIFGRIRELEAGYRLLESRASFQWRLLPASPRALPNLSAAYHPAARLSSARGFANPAWARMEAALRARLGLDARWALVPAAAERGPQRLLTEAANRLTPAVRIRAGDELIQRLDAYWRRGKPAPDRDVPTLHVARREELRSVLDRRNPGDLVAVDLGPLSDWPEPASTGRELLAEVDVLWASDPAGPETGGGFLGFARPIPLYRAIRDQMLFAVGSVHDGGLSPDGMSRLADALTRGE
jgi:tryptophanase